MLSFIKIKQFINDEPFIACAGDSLFIGKNMIKELIKSSKYVTNNNIMVIKRVDKPQKHGVIIPGEKK